MKEGTYCYNCGAKLASTYAEKEIIKRLEQENAELKKQIEIAKANYLQEEDFAEMYKQTLQEIKEIAECVIDNDNSLKTDHCFGHCGECKSFNHCKLYPYWQITHLITKAEVGE